MLHEYERLRRARVGGSFTTALSAGAEGRNRYSNVLPFDANRVRLQVRLAFYLMPHSLSKIH